MSNAIIAGNPSPIEQGYAFTIRKSGGGVEVTRAWAGTPDAILSQAISLYNDATVTELEARHEAGSAIAVVRAKYSSIPYVDEPVQEQVSLRWIDASIDLHRNPTFIGISSARIKELEDEVAKAGGGTQPTNPTEVKYWKLRIRGVQSYIAKLPVVTYTRTAPRQTDETINASGSGKIVPLAGIPVESFFTLGEINLGFSADSEGMFSPGWMLQADGDIMSSGNSQLIETYTYGLWEIDLYDFV